MSERENDLTAANEEVTGQDQTKAAPEAATDEAGAQEDIGQEGLGEVDQLKKQIEELTAKADENWNLYLRSQAEIENVRKRGQKDVESAHKYAVEKFVAELIPIKESMDLGYAASHEEDVDIAKIKEGTELTLKMFSSMFDKFKIVEVNPKGEKFNPSFHEAISMLPSPEFDANTVIDVVQKGYLLNERVIKPALVVVSNGPGSKGDDDQPSIDETA
ncbi:MAG: nucleotide exchange factor GrpE [Gammaproteobacteria bacterium]|nr:MAG: nucleotide exchange factor GrpE [Gammaproteobacteria bacterium]